MQRALVLLGLVLATASAAAQDGAPLGPEQGGGIDDAWNPPTAADAAGGGAVAWVFAVIVLLVLVGLAVALLRGRRTATRR